MDKLIEILVGIDGAFGADLPARLHNVLMAEKIAGLRPQLPAVLDAKFQAVLAQIPTAIMDEAQCREVAKNLLGIYKSFVDRAAQLDARKGGT